MCCPLVLYITKSRFVCFCQDKEKTAAEGVIKLLGNSGIDINYRSLYKLREQGQLHCLFCFSQAHLKRVEGWLLRKLTGFYFYGSKASITFPLVTYLRTWFGLVI